MDRKVATAKELRELALVQDIERLNLGTAEEIIAESDRLVALTKPLLEGMVDKSNPPDLSRRAPTNEEQSELMLQIMLVTRMDLEELEDKLYGYIGMCALANISMRKVKELQELEEAINA